MFKLSYLQIFITSILLFACNKELILSEEGSVGKVSSILESADEQEAIFMVFLDELILQTFSCLTVK